MSKKVSEKSEKKVARKKVAPPPCDCKKCKKANGGKCPDALPSAPRVDVDYPDMGYFFNKDGKTCALTVNGYDVKKMPEKVAKAICDHYHGRDKKGAK